jgi:hypothetical protein
MWANLGCEVYFFLKSGSDKNARDALVKAYDAIPGLGVVRVVQCERLALHYTSLVAKFFTPHHTTPNYTVDTTLY